MKERWEVRSTFRRDDRIRDVCKVESRNAAWEYAVGASERGWVAKVVRVRTYRVEVVYAWRTGLGHYSSDGDWWSDVSRCGWVDKGFRTLYADPLGKHSRRRAKKVALAAKPSGPCVLVAVRRRVQE